MDKTIQVCEEMQKLRDYLDAHEIEWEDVSEDFTKGIDVELPVEFWICRTHFDFCGNRYSVINGVGTFGGIYVGSGENLWLLELMSDAVNKGEPMGYLTAEEIIESYLKEEDCAKSGKQKAKRAIANA